MGNGWLCVSRWGGGMRWLLALCVCICMSSLGRSSVSSVLGGWGAALACLEACTVVAAVALVCTVIAVGPAPVVLWMANVVASPVGRCGERSVLTYLVPPREVIYPVATSPGLGAV